MSEFDLVLKNGTVFLPSGRENTDIGIKEDKIVFIGDIGDSNNSLDCTDLFIFPGLIDTQCHFREPGGEHKETIQTGTMSAALGGITGIFEMPNTNPLTTTPEALEHKIKRGVDTAYTDFAFYFGGTHENSSNLPEWEKLPGVCGIKIFMGSSTGNLLSATDEEVEAVVANGRRVIAVHAEDEFIMNENKKTILKDSNDVGMHCKWRNVESALNATRRVVTLGKKHNRHIHVLHITTADEMDFLRDNKDTATVEVLPNHLTLHAPDCYEELGTLAQQNPPIREKEHQDALWRAVDDGTVDIVASDHAPHTLEEKKRLYTKCPSGGPMVQHSIISLLTESKKHNVGVEKIVEKISHNPSIVFNIKNRGFIREGYFADIVLINTKKSYNVSKDSLLYKCNWSPFEGQTFDCSIYMTFVNGKIVYDKGKIVSNPIGEQLIFDR